MDQKEIKRILLGIGVDTFNRFQVFLSISSELKGKNYWIALRLAYTDSDNLFKFRHLLKHSFLSCEPGREYLMNKRERAYLQNLPDLIPIYRAMTVKEFKSGEFGVSWTLKKDIAEFFIKYFRNVDTKRFPKKIHQLTIKKSDVVAYINNRKEFEIIYLHP